MKLSYTKLIMTIHQNSSHLLTNPEMQLFSIVEQVKHCVVNLGSISSKKVSAMTKSITLSSQKVTTNTNLAWRTGYSCQWSYNTHHHRYHQN